MACCKASRLFAAISFRTSATEGTDASVALEKLTPSDSAATNGPTPLDTAATGERACWAAWPTTGEELTAGAMSMDASLLRASASEKSTSNNFSLDPGHDGAV